MNKRLFWRMALMLVITLAVFGVLIGFQIYKPTMIRGFILAGGRPPAVVTTIRAELQPWQPTLAAVGSLRAVRGVDLAAEVGGLIRSVEFHSGDNAAQGAVLVQLNADTELANLKALQAQADLAQTVYERDKQQYAIDAISKALLDADEHDLKVKRRQIEQQAALVEKKSIRAPFSGRLGISTMQPGQFINPGDRIVSLQQIDQVYADFALPQQALPQVRVGQSVTLTIDSWPGKTFAGRINAIDPKVDTATRTLQVEAMVPNARHELLPGMYANVSVVQGAARSLLTVPLTAISFNSYGATAFVVLPADNGSSSPAGTSASPAGSAPAAAGSPAAASGTVNAGGSGGKAGTPADSKPANRRVEQRFVKTGETRGDQIAILDGVKPGEEVVTSGQLKLKNGDPVAIDNSVQPSNNPAPAPVDR